MIKEKSTEAAKGCYCLAGREILECLTEITEQIFSKFTCTEITETCLFNSWIMYKH